MKITPLAVALVAPMWAWACGSASDGGRSSSSSIASVADAAPSCPEDAAAFSARASCVYGIPSDAATLSACDEWLQGPGGDWDSFAETCASEHGGLSADPCARDGNVGSCTFPVTCEGERVTYYFGASGTASFAQACAGSPGATWAAP